MYAKAQGNGQWALINWLIFMNCVSVNWILKQLTLWLHITVYRSLLQCLSYLIMCLRIYLEWVHIIIKIISFHLTSISLYGYGHVDAFD